MGLIDTLTFYQSWADRLRLAVSPHTNPVGDYRPIISLLDQIQLKGNEGIHDAFVAIRRTLRYSTDDRTLRNTLLLIDAGLKNLIGFINAVDRPKFADVFVKSVIRVDSPAYRREAADHVLEWLTLFPTAINLQAVQLALTAAAVPMQIRQLPPGPSDQSQVQRPPEPVKTAQEQANMTASKKLDEDIDRLSKQVDSFRRELSTATGPTRGLDAARGRCQLYIDRMEQVIGEWTFLAKMAPDTVQRYVDAFESIKAVIQEYDDLCTGRPHERTAPMSPTSPEEVTLIDLMATTPLPNPTPGALPPAPVYGKDALPGRQAGPGNGALTVVGGIGRTGEVDDLIEGIPKPEPRHEQTLEQLLGFL
ncbi:hypothetical protein J8273_0389 [Carpediemonas membranifera]|uniref:VHS domain-containing protein n=1 Tax=Carpediemonas membranifera TaxID=201153 RepID=A0A8J6E0I4_9EUKA|nr:hypothetical protein J8273_0389 [Carpediemonas membranifera]|eukprot:KAG9395169.1 hypothetical protein J8273_0389 [Carpediemonas membranifera]